MVIPGPDTRVVELRVHGVLGTTPEDLTGSVSAVEVAGDGLGRLVRPADRLRRPAPGPMLNAGGRPVPRVVEGYVWGGMTSGGFAKATWALLFPFAMANVAHWMLPPAREDNAVSRVLGHLLRALLRLAALLLSCLLVSQLTVLFLDLVATQCLRPGSSCLPFAPESLREWDVGRAVLGLLPVVALVAMLHRVSTVSWQVNRSTDPLPADPERRRNRLAGLPGETVIADPDTPVLRMTHTVATLAVAAILALGGPAGAADGANDWLWWAAATLFLFGLLATALLDDPPELRAKGGLGGRVRRFLGSWPSQVLVAASVLLVALVAARMGPLPTELPASTSTVEVVAALLALCCVLFGALLVPAAWLARLEWRGRPRDQRPWAGGWFSAPVLTLAALLGAGFGAGLTLSVRQLLGRGHLAEPESYEAITLLWGAGAVLTVVAVAVVVPVVFFRRWLAERRDRLAPPETTLLHAGRPEDSRVGARAWWWAAAQRRHLHHILLLVAGVLSAGALIALVVRVADLALPNWFDPLAGIGVAVLAALALALLRTVHLAKRRPETAKLLGILADLTSFWPREAHPTVPPCYALKVIPELADRVVHHLKDPGVRVVITGHSQGSLLAAVTAARLAQSLPDADRHRVGLVTHGSQLQWIYARAFPSVVPLSSLAELSGALRGRWRSLCRGTDPLGGPVTTWNRQVYEGTLIGVGFRADGSVGPLPAATRSPNGALVLGGDHWLPDPMRGPFTGRRWSPGVLSHYDYPVDPEWDRAVAIAAGLELPPRDTPTTGSLLSALGVGSDGAAAGQSAPPGAADPIDGGGGGGVDPEGRGRPPGRPSKTSLSASVPPPTEVPRGRSTPWERAAELPVKGG